MDSFHGEGIGKEALFGDPFERAFLESVRDGSDPGVEAKAVSISSGGEDEDAAPSLGVAVVGGVDHTPFYTVPFIIEAAQDDAEITATLPGGGFQQSVHVLQQDEPGMAQLDDLIDGPPQNALLTLDALGAGMGHGVILAGETAYQKIVLRHIVDDGGDVLVAAVGLISKALAVAFVCPLAGLAGLPLTGPNSLESGRAALQTYAEAADTREKLNDPDLLCIIHFRASSFCAMLETTNSVYHKIRSRSST